jgi:DNA-binding NarL/FixJ family response regulator
MPEMSGLDVVREAKTEGIRTPLLVLTTHPEEQYAIRVLKAGASGFLSKETAGDELINAFRKILAGKRYITESLAELLAGDLNHDHDKLQHECLSDREFEVFKHIALGKTVSEIAAVMFLSVPTISTYRRRILEKMNMKNNAEIMHYAVTLNLE